MNINNSKNKLEITVYETSAKGNKLAEISLSDTVSKEGAIEIKPEDEYQVITGFGGSFTESSAFLLNQLSKENRNLILEAYFGQEGARYSLTRTHINSCDFSLSNYSYAPVEGDENLELFSIYEDEETLIPMILEAKRISKDGFKIISSPWTAPPWMKDNNSWVGGKLLPKYHKTWALFFSKYIKAYNEKGIDIWGVTVENEPHGNGDNWESMLYTPEEMSDFVKNHLGPKLAEEHSGVKILGYDQNRDGLKDWVDEMYKTEESSKYFSGTAIHWYESTYEVFPEALQYAYKKAPSKYLIQTEACVDAEVPRWKDDDWYWEKGATDWGYDWAPDHQKHWHPEYVPVFRYARDIIGCLNNYVDGWIDWNMVLDTQGGPNWFKNWCVAPVIVKPDTDEVYFTPIYYTLSHFSKYIRPDAVRIGFVNTNPYLQVTAARNPDDSIVIVVFNETTEVRGFNVKLLDFERSISIDGKAIQTIVISNSK